MDSYSGVAREMGIKAKEIETIQSIVMAVSAGRVRAQFRKARSSKRYFDRIGAAWDGMQAEFFSDGVRDRAFRVAGVERGRTAVDLGAGTGFVTAGLVARGVTVIAVDQSRAMLDALRAKFPEVDAVDCRVGDAEQIPVDDASVSYCFANMCLHHVEHPSRAIGEMARILEPGGRLVVTDLDRHDHAFLLTEHHDRWMGFERGEVLQWLRDAGLESPSVESAGQQCCTAGPDGETVSIAIFVASGTKP